MKRNVKGYVLRWVIIAIICLFLSCGLIVHISKKGNSIWRESPEIIIQMPSGNVLSGKGRWKTNKDPVNGHFDGTGTFEIDEKIYVTDWKNAIVVKLED